MIRQGYWFPTGPNQYHRVSRETTETRTNTIEERVGLLNQITKLFTFATDIYLANRYNSVSLSNKNYLL